MGVHGHVAERVDREVSSSYEAFHENSTIADEGEFARIAHGAGVQLPVIAGINASRKPKPGNLVRLLALVSNGHRLNASGQARYRLTVFIGALVATLLDPSISAATHVVVRVLNVAEGGGTVRVAFCRKSEWLAKNCAYGGRAAAHPGIVDVSIDVPPGEYGVLVHHDSNDDDRINKNFLGLPVEGVGFSRDAPIRFGFPSFSSVSLLIDGDEAATSVSLIFEPSGASVND